MILVFGFEENFTQFVNALYAISRISTDFVVIFAFLGGQIFVVQQSCKIFDD